MIEFFDVNRTGRDFVVGDIHGCFSQLKQQLNELEFDESRDRLFSCGDLVDRGPESDLVVEWLNHPWFHPVCGNHDEWTIQGAINGRLYVHEANGGEWLYRLPSDAQHTIGRRLAKLPIAIQVTTYTKAIGIVHAEVPWGDWTQFSEALRAHHVPTSVTSFAQWSRTKIQHGDSTPVTGIDHVYVGHTVVDELITLGNTTYIDTGHVFDKSKQLAIIQLN